MTNPGDSDIPVQDDDTDQVGGVTVDQGSDDDDGDAKQPLTLEISVAEPSTCQRHVTVVVARDDIDRYWDDAVTELVPKASVPGFRVGRAPRKLVHQRFKEQLSDQVKGSLLMDSMTQVTEDLDFAAISEPDFDYAAIELPDDGPMTFEFDVEVRPEFDLPDWKGLKLERLVKSITDADVDQQLEKLLDGHGELVSYEGPAELNDYVVASIVCSKDGKEISRLEHETIQVKPVLSFPDGNLTDFGELMTGVVPGDVKETPFDIISDAQVEALQGQRVDMLIEVHDVQQLELPELNAAILDRLGFESEGELRDAIRDVIARRIKYHSDQHVRQQITSQLVETAGWQLPPELLRRQSARELQRAVMELRSSGFTEAHIRARQNELRRNSQENTARALKEHFILERIADDLEIEPSDKDYEIEFERIAEQSGEPVRRIRARIEKQNMNDVIRNQITERLVIDRITEHAKFTDLEFKPQENEEVAVDHMVCGGSASAIPEAKYADNQQSGIQQPVDRT